MSSNICFVGGGNMASAIIGGLLANGTKAAAIEVVDPNEATRDKLVADHAVKVSMDAGSACAAAETVVLAVKPQIIHEVAAQMKGTVDFSGKLLISVMAGVTTQTMAELFGDTAIARTMPNTPALLGLGATGLFCNDKTTDEQRAEAVSIIEAFGICVPVDREELLDVVTAVSGSGPAYYFLMIEEMIKAGEALGLSREAASALTLQTALGAASMAAKGDVDPAELRRRVTSPNGTTHAAIVSMQENGYGDVIEKAMIACRDRAIELGNQ